MSTFTCSLCGSTKFVERARRDVRQLVEGYQARFGIDVRRYFPAPTLGTLECVECRLRTHFPASPGDGAFYDSLQRFDFYYEREKHEFSFILDRILDQQPRRVLDVGSGAGMFLDKVAPGFDVRGSDLSEDSKRKMRDKGLLLDEPADRYDFIVTFQVIEHVPDVRAFVTFMVDKLEPGGHLFIATVNNDAKFSSEVFALLDHPPHHLTQWSRRALEGLAPRFGLELVEYYQEPHRLDHYLTLIGDRRKRVTGGGLKGRVLRTLGTIADKALGPYFFDQIDYPGTTHGVLLGKPR